MRTILILCWIFLLTPSAAWPAQNTGAKGGRPQNEAAKEQLNKGQEADATKHEQNHPSDAPAPSKPLPTLTTANNESRTKQIKSDGHGHPNPWSNLYILLTLVIAGSGIVTAWAAWRQSRSGKKSADALIRAQSAQIQIRIDNPLPKLKVGNPPIIKTDLTNRGATPAYSLKFETWIEIRPFPFDDFTSVASYSAADHTITIYPNAPDPSVIQVIADFELTNQDLSALMANAKLLCLRVRVAYKDAFGIDRWQNFGLFVAGRLGMGYLSKYNDCSPN